MTVRDLPVRRVGQAPFQTEVGSMPHRLAFGQFIGMVPCNSEEAVASVEVAGGVVAAEVVEFPQGVS